MSHPFDFAAQILPLSRDVVAQILPTAECYVVGCDQIVSRITPKIYLTGLKGALDYERLRSLGIEHIVSIGCGKIHRLKNCPFTVSMIDLDDVPTASIMPYFDYIYERTKNKVTLFHCAMGISRSATMVIACLANEDPTYDVDRAYRFVKSQRPYIMPNPGFYKQLKFYQLRKYKEKLLSTYAAQ